MVEIKNLGLELLGKEIFSGVNLQMNLGDKVGVIGGEGSGKTSLLDIIAGRLIQTSGEVKVGGEVFTVIGGISADFSELRMAEMSAIEKLKRTLRGLKDEEIVLLLDEPTKNLDADGVEWLITFLRERKKLTTIMASGDRYFLNATCKNIIRLGSWDVAPINFSGAENLETYAAGDLTAPIVLEVERLLKVRAGETVFKHINFTIRRGQKIAFVGRNKIGKTQLMKSFAAAAENPGSNGGIEHGEINFADGVKVAYMPKVFSPLSAKVEIAKLQTAGANFLLLDNPTSCLDLPMIEALERGLQSYKGNIILIDDDRTFVNAIANRIMDIAPTGTVDRIASYEDFLQNETVCEQIREKYNE